MKKEWLYTWDVETRDRYGKIFKLAVFDGIKTHLFNSVKDFIQYLDNLNEDLQNKNEKAYFFAHYHDFDILKLFQYCIEKDFKIRINTHRTIISDRKFLNLVFRRWNRIIFRDSYRVIPIKLDKITKEFDCKVKKIDLEKEVKKLGYKTKEHFFREVDPNNELLEEYLTNDVVGLHEALVKFIEITKVNLKKLITTASVAMEVFQTRFEDDYKSIILDDKRQKEVGYKEDVRKFKRSGYLGGRVEVVKRVLEKGYTYDVNSLYPYCMYNFEYPAGNYKVIPEKLPGRDIDKEVVKHEFNRLFRKRDKLGMVRAKVYVPESVYIPPLPIKIKQKIYYPVGEFKGTWTSPELFHAIEKYGVKVLKIEKIIVWNKKIKPFVKYVDEFYKLKLQGDSVRRFIAKLLMNSLYGKFGMREVKEKFFYEDEFNEKYKDKYEVKRKTYFLGEPVIIIDDDNWSKRKSYIKPHIAAFITSYSRLVLIKEIEDKLEKGYDIVYYDTDSLHTNCQPNEFGKVDEKKLGYWKLEKTVEKGYYILPKFYSLKTEKDSYTKIKGVPKDKMLSFDEIKKLYENLKTHITFDCGKRLPSAYKQMQQNEVIEYENIRKTLCLITDKRKFINLEETKPWKYDEIIKLDFVFNVKYDKDVKVKEVYLEVNGHEVRSFDEYIKICKNLEERKEDVNKELQNNRCTA